MSNDKELMESALEGLIEQQERQQLMVDKEAELLVEMIELEALYYDLWTVFNGIIVEYERELEYMSGRFVHHPISNKDVIEHAKSRGRLTNFTVSMSVKIIPQFNGSPISKTIKVHEFTRDAEMWEYVKLLREGTSATTTRLGASYSAGSSEIRLWSTTTAESWVLVDNETLLRLGKFLRTDTVTIPGSPPGSYSIYVYAVTAERINDKSFSGGRFSGARVGSWPGYTDTERSSKVPTSTTQECFDDFLVQLDDELEIKEDWVRKSYNSLFKNRDQNKNSGDLSTHKDDLDFLVAWRAAMIVDDPAMDSLEGMLTDRDVFIPERLSRAMQDKSLYYPSRISYTNLRCDRQNGTLPYIYFVERVIERYPYPGLNDAIETLRGTLENV